MHHTSLAQENACAYDSWQVLSPGWDPRSTQTVKSKMMIKIMKKIKSTSRSKIRTGAVLLILFLLLLIQFLIVLLLLILLLGSTITNRTGRTAE